jgi:hypothetical protein
MKKIIFLTAILAFALNAGAQDLRESEVPQPVISKFNSMYPNVTGAKWEVENGNYEAEFKENNVETSVLIDANGTYVQSETEIAVSSLPQSVRDYASKNLPGKNITEACLVSNADGTVSYEAEIGKKDYLFDGNGNFIRMEADSNDSEDDDK